VSKPKPTWRKVFDKVERTLGEPLETAVSSYRFVNVMSMGKRTKGAVTGRAGRLVGGVLHKVNIATRDDVQGLNKNLASLATEVRATQASPAPAPVAKKATAVTKAPPDKKTAATKKTTPAKRTAAKKTAAASKATPTGQTATPSNVPKQ